MGAGSNLVQEGVVKMYTLSRGVAVISTQISVSTTMLL